MITIARLRTLADRLGLTDPDPDPRLNCGCDPADHPLVGCPDRCGYTTCHQHRHLLDGHDCPEVRTM